MENQVDMKMDNELATGLYMHLNRWDLVQT